MGALLMSTEMINEFTHNEELISSLLELFITLELTSRQGQPVFSEAAASGKGQFLRYGHFFKIIFNMKLET